MEKSPEASQKAIKVRYNLQALLQINIVEITKLNWSLKWLKGKFLISVIRI